MMMLQTDLFDFAYVPEWYRHLYDLKCMALPEAWQFILTDFDEGLMNIMLEKITAFSDRLEFEFKDGNIVKYSIK